MTRLLTASPVWMRRLSPQLERLDLLASCAWLQSSGGLPQNGSLQVGYCTSAWGTETRSQSPCPCSAQHLPRSYSRGTDRESFEWVGGLPHPAPREASPMLDTDHRSPTDMVWPASRQQQKAASRVRTALSLAFMDASRRDLFMDKLGLSILEVRMSPDHMTAFVLWEANESEVEATRQALSRSVRDIRGAMARHLHAKRIPRLEFRYNALTGAQEEVETEMERLELERQLEQLQSGS